MRKLSASGVLLWSTYLTNNRVGVGYPVAPADTLSGIAAGADGSIYITGGGSPNWPITPGAYRMAYDGPPARAWRVDLRPSSEQANRDLRTSTVRLS